jgi:Zn finger protein HypA/HybF involved in hydrogenase expression
MKTLREYTQYMGYFPSYMFPEKVDEDEEFEYYKVKVPRIFIREHIATGDNWLDYEETDEEGTLDKSVVLGVIWLLAYKGTEYLEADADFLYYKIKVPIVFLNTPIRGGGMYYREMYNTRQLNVNPTEEQLEAAFEETKKEIPAAGSPMPGIHHAPAVVKAKETTVYLYELEMQCMNIPECGVIHVEVCSDLFDGLAGRICGVCGSKRFTLVSAKKLIEEDNE